MVNKQYLDLAGLTTYDGKIKAHINSVASNKADKTHNHTVSDITGVTMKADKEGVTNDGSARTVVYVPNPIGSADTVTVSIEQFSESVTTNQVWADYENSRIRRKDMEFVEGIGEDCYIAYPYINVYVRGCFIRISAGSGDNDEQADLLKSLAKSAALKVEGMITPEQVEAANANVLK